MAERYRLIGMPQLGFVLTCKLGSTSYMTPVQEDAKSNLEGLMAQEYQENVDVHDVDGWSVV
ncbi:uncharacterized protein N7496_000686 [Penicillium cataractarum]|uniref:Uncharacterized protein n=1 Tax=Penicillium cataractarum TaxID=2100454 RepID=A0A9W9VUN9_9EURO|nr:uncharacterized protein N7496_000686 [Penicillium cataractarum]KAJ5389618.1 hypothetical protein N7496_000686 [Penicillium cataractarum]